jgi:hypothetical protein
MSKLIFSEFFNHKGQSFPWYLWQTLKDFPRVLKARHQRATRGWADCDVWSMDSWFMNVVPDMLRRLRDTPHGYPSEFEHLGKEAGPKEWERILTNMADDLEAYNRFDDRWFGEDGTYTLDLPPAQQTLQSKQCSVEEMEALRIVKRGLFDFWEWFYALWD